MDETFDICLQQERIASAIPTPGGNLASASTSGILLASRAPLINIYWFVLLRRERTSEITQHFFFQKIIVILYSVKRIGRRRHFDRWSNQLRKWRTRLHSWIYSDLHAQLKCRQSWARSRCRVAVLMTSFFLSSFRSSFSLQWSTRISIIKMSIKLFGLAKRIKWN